MATGSRTVDGVASRCWRFADLSLDVGQRRVTRNGATIPLSKLSFDFLRLLAEAWPNLVTHDELIESVWGPRRVVTPENISKRVLLLRNALSDDAGSPRYIEVVRGQGYRLVPEVERVPPARAEPARTRPSRRLRNVLAGAAIAAAALGAIAAVLVRPPASPPDTARPGRAVRFELALLPDQPFVSPYYARDLAISNDGTTIGYTSRDNSIVVRPLDRIESRQISGLGTDSRNPTFSPDGTQLAYLDGAALVRIPITGSGAGQIVARIGQFTDGDIHWARADTILAANSLGLQRIDLDGNTELLLRPDPAAEERAFNAPTLLPGDRAVLFAVEPTRAELGSRVAVFDLQSRQRTYILDDATQPTYIDTGYLLFASGDELQAVAFDPVSFEAGHERITLAAGIVVNANGTANLSVAADGTMVYATGSAPAANSLSWLGRDGSEESLPVPAMNYSYPRLSPDGRFIALDVRWPDSDIWLWELGRQVLTRLTNDPAENALPVWSRDSTTLYFGDGRSGPTNVFVGAIDGGGPPRRLLPSDNRQLAFDVSADGRSLLIGETHSSGAWHVQLLDPDSGKLTPLLDGEFSFWNTDVSPDGNWLVYQSDESGRLEVYARPFPDVASGRWQISGGGGTKPMWGRDGNEIFYISPDLQLMSVAVERARGLVASTPEKVLDLSGYLDNPYEVGARPYDISPFDGRFLLVKRVNPAAGPGRSRIVVSANWTAELEQRLPRP